MGYFSLGHTSRPPRQIDASERKKIAPILFVFGTCLEGERLSRVIGWWFVVLREHISTRIRIG